jgi:hypothetical protein
MLEVLEELLLQTWLACAHLLAVGFGHARPAVGGSMQLPGVVVGGL